MAGISVGSTTGADVDHLREQVRGQVITAADDDYGEARAVHNGMFDKRPLAVLRAEQVADVIVGVNFARENGLDLSVRGGGHSAPGFGTNDGGLVIDMTPMRTVRVDPRNQTARADAGATWGDFNHATHAFGLATTGGIISTTGITGLTLGGGIGYLARGCGLSIDNLISADVVTADGRFVTASERKNEDLFWGLRGGGGNFGVVTSLEYRLHEVDQVFAGPIFYNLEDASSLLRMFDEFIREAPEQFGGFPGFQIAPPLPFIPEDRHGDTLALAVVHWTGPLEQAEEVLKPFREVAPIVADGTGPLPYPALNGAFDGLYPKGIRAYWKGAFVTDLPDAAIAAHVEHGSRVPEVSATMHMYPINGACHRLAPRTRRFPTVKQPTGWSSWPHGPIPPRTRSGSSGCATTTRRWLHIRNLADTSTSCRTTITGRSATTTARTTISWSRSSASTTPTISSTSTRT